MQDTQPPTAQGTGQWSRIFPVIRSFGSKIVMAGDEPGHCLDIG
jgi:hypothetical protein